MFFRKKCVGGRASAGACVAHYENVCDVRVGADENLCTLKPNCFKKQHSSSSLVLT